MKLGVSGLPFNTVILKQYALPCLTVNGMVVSHKTERTADPMEFSGATWTLPASAYVFAAAFFEELPFLEGEGEFAGLRLPSATK